MNKIALKKYIKETFQEQLDYINQLLKINVDVQLKFITTDISNFWIKNGKYIVSINLDDINIHNLHLTEYEHYQDDPLIGNRVCKDWKQFVRILISHELSHAITKYIHPHDEDPSYDYHGEQFMGIYKLIRETFEYEKSTPFFKRYDKYIV